MTNETAFRIGTAKTHRLTEDSGAPSLDTRVVYGFLYAACGFKRYYTSFKPHGAVFLTPDESTNPCRRCWKD